MKATLIASPFGVLAFDEDIKLVEKTLFPKKPLNSAKIFFQLELGKIDDDIIRMIGALKDRGYDLFVFENSDLAKEVQEKCNVRIEVLTGVEAGELLRSHADRFAVETGFAKDTEDFSLWMRNFTMEITKLRVKGAGEKRDLVVAQAIQTLDELDKTINILMTRVREWYGIHFPELDRLLEKHETYARLVLELGAKGNFTGERLERIDVPKPKAEAIAKVAEKSMGADMVDADLAQIQALCRDVLELYQLRQGLERYIDSTMEEVAPNMKYLVGSLLGARLIAVAGGLENLAKRPASTIQILGAEKALFRSLKTGARPPKHGMIFQHAMIHDAKRWQRGKVARALAGKLAIATRADAFGRRAIGEELKAGLDKRIEEIRQKYDQPPPVPILKPTAERSERQRLSDERPRRGKKWRKRKRER